MDRILGALFGLLALVGVAVLCLGIGLGLLGLPAAFAGGVLTVAGVGLSFALMGDD